MKKRSIGILLAGLLVVSAAIGGTAAWLTDAKEATNTFIVGDLEIDLEEPNWNDNQKIYPGVEIPKNPEVTVKVGSEECYVFVSVDNKLASVTNLDISDDWKDVAQEGNKVLYKYKETVNALAEEKVLTDVFTKVSVGDGVTREQLRALSGNDQQIIIKAYAHQVEETTYETALANAKSSLGFTAGL